eukprot:10584901-Heterocapsa_arctica.AAC.1
MEDKPKKRKSRSKLGALSTNRNNNLGIGHHQERLGTYYTLMEQTKSNTGMNQWGYIMFEDLGNKEYAGKLNEQPNWLRAGAQT